MSPIVPARVLGGAVLVEAAPFSPGLANVYRGMDLGEFPAGPARVSAAGASPRGPYRAKSEAEPPPVSAPVPVIARELGELGAGDPELQRMFAEVTLARHRMQGTPAPRLLHVLGRGGKVLASVEEHLAGTPLDRVQLAQRRSGEEVPVPIALAIGEGLVALWSRAAPLGIDLSVDPTGVILGPAGVVRVVPTYNAEQAREEVGAALVLFPRLVSYTYPERIVGDAPDARGAMYALGLLLYEMIAGAHPFASEATAFRVMDQMVHGEAPPLRERRSGLHPSVAAFVHRCLARDPAARFASWRELSRAYAAIRALFPPTGTAEIAGYVRRLVPTHPVLETPMVIALDAGHLWSLPSTGYHAVSLPAPAPSTVPGRTVRTLGGPSADPEAIYPGDEGRPMYRVSEALHIDARPVTRAEIERFFLATRAPRPEHLLPLGAADDEPCVLVPFEVAEAYARWAGKRLPTEMEWLEAVEALGTERLGVGEVWEWTSTPHQDGGYAVRGGRWRDVPIMPPDPRNRSFATSPATDLGFRCAMSTP